MNAAASPADSLARDFLQWRTSDVERQSGDFAPIKPDHYRPWHWPLHPVSFDYHIPASEWHGRANLEFDGDQYTVEVARTPWGVFGRCEALRAEAKGETEELMLDSLVESCEPLFERQAEISRIAGFAERYTGSIRDLEPAIKLRLLYSSDRAIAHDAQLEIETGGELTLYGPALVSILLDSEHRHRRTAQWLVLDLFEDLQSFCPEESAMQEAVAAIKTMMWEAQDDFARTIYKAGVVLGGHVCNETSARTILQLISAPSRIARRSAMHASFHLCEWMPERKDDVLAALLNAAQNDSEPLLRPYCAGLIVDIKNEVIDHIAEPMFPDEP